MKTGISPIARRHHQSMPHWVVVYVLDAVPEMVVIADCLLPEPVLPEPAAFAEESFPFHLRPEPAFECGNRVRVVSTSGAQEPMEMVRKNGPGFVFYFEDSCEPLHLIEQWLVQVIPGNPRRAIASHKRYEENIVGVPCLVSAIVDHRAIVACEWQIRSRPMGGR